MVVYSDDEVFEILRTYVQTFHANTDRLRILPELGAIASIIAKPFDPKGSNLSLGHVYKPLG